MPRPLRMTMLPRNMLILLWVAATRLLAAAQLAAASQLVAAAQRVLVVELDRSIVMMMMMMQSLWKKCVVFKWVVVCCCRGGGGEGVGLGWVGGLTVVVGWRCWW